MFIGHYAVALAAAVAPRAPKLGPLFVAALLPDIAFALLVLAGVEHAGLVPGTTVMSPLDLNDAPWSHSLLGTLGLAAAFAVALRLAGAAKNAAWIGAAVVAAHWPLDWLVHAPDLGVWGGGGRRYGLALWNHPYLAMPLELGLAFVAATFYANRTRSAGWGGRAALALTVAAMTALQVAGWLLPGPREALYALPRSVPLTMLAAFTIPTVLAWWTGALRMRA